MSGVGDTALAYAVEQGHWARISAWALGSLVIGIAMLLVKGEKPSRHFAYQAILWGGMNLPIGLWFYYANDPNPTLQALAQTRETIMLNLGFDCGYTGVGTTMTILGFLTDRDGTIGAGVGIVTQALVLLVLDGLLMALLPHAI